MDLDSDSVEDLLVFSTTYGYLGQDQHVQIFLVKMVAHSRSRQCSRPNLIVRFCENRPGSLAVPLPPVFLARGDNRL